MRSPGRTLRELGVVGIVLALVVGIVVAAVQAEGERTIRPETNDGGAWLINRAEGAVGHINRTAGEVTGAARIASPGDAIDTEQSGEAVLVLNRSTDELILVDTRTFQDFNTISVPDDLEMRIIDDRATLWTTSPLQVWTFTLDELSQIQVLDEEPLTVSDPGPGLVEVTRFGAVLVVATESQRLIRFDPLGTELPTVDLGAVGGDVVALSAQGDSAALLTKAGALYVIEPDSGEMSDPFAFGAVAALGQPVLPGEPIVAVTEDGTVLATTVDREGDIAVVSIAEVDGSGPMPPLFHRDCVFVVMSSPATLTRSCAGDPERIVTGPSPLPGTSGASLRLRLVNGWVWVNDLRTGISWVIDESAPLDRIDDWGAALGNNDGEGEESQDLSSGEVEQRENPDADDAELIRADEIDEDGMNEPPVARPDTATTRVDLPVIVDALRNDEDPDGDVILITSVEGAPAEALVDITGDRRSVQVIPPAGFIGDITMTYTISDGRGGTDSDVITVTVIPATGIENRPPNAVTDVVEARAGTSAALNVLDNDSDPDGDSIVLDAVVAPSGSVTFDGSGQVTFVPDPATTERSIDLSYTISDSFGATAVGSIRVAIRLKDSNNEPDARNDSAVTVVGRPVTINVLVNDTDPDGDAISVAAPPVLIAPDPSDDVADNIEVSLSTDGQFFFVAQEPGEYLYSYSIIDGSERDTALIRIDVTPADVNRPPVAVRDDATISRGASATVFVLANDTDPDGDVVAIENVYPSEFLVVESFRGIGFIVTVLPEAPSQVSFQYTITDGVSEPVPGTVVIAVTDTDSVDQPPVVQPDVIEARPGGTTAARVLLNDFDPEGGTLRVDRVSTVDGVEIRIGQAGQEIFVTLPDDAVNGFSFSYDVVDVGQNRSAGIVDVRIVPSDGTNRPPIARADTTRTRSDVAVTVAVLDNDSDPDGDPIRIESIVAQPAAGIAVVTEDGTVTYTPDDGFAGTDRFAYVIVDQFGDRAIGDVLIGVIPETEENRPPTAIDDEFTIVAGSDAFTLPVTSNDYDPDGDVLRISRFTQADSVRLDDAATSLIFTPPAAIEAESVQVTMTYRIEDGRGGSADAVVTVTVVKAVEPDPPVPADDIAGPIRTGETILVRVLDNDIDPDGRREALVVQSLDGAGAVGAEPGTLVFTAGDETSTHPYSVTDADGLSAQAFVTILVTENVAPVVEALTVTTPFETAIALPLGAQATDRDEDPLFFACCEAARNGTATVTESSSGVLDVTFTPDPGYSGPAGFSYSVDDQQGHVVASTVVITVEAKENSAPTATDIVAEVEAGTTGSISLSASADDIDIETGDELTYSIDGAPDSVVRSGEAVAITVPIAAAGDAFDFTYTVTDSDGESATAAVAVTVTESQVNAPTAVDDTGQTTQGVAVTVDVVSNDLDEIGGGLSLVAAGSSTPQGQIGSDESAGTVTFEPDPGFFGTTTINYTIEDIRATEGGQAVGLLTVEVVGFPAIPATPQAVADNATATVTWAQPAANGAPIEEFELRSDRGQIVLLPPSSSHTFNDLENGVPHAFEIRARNEAGWSDWSTASPPVTPDTEPQRPGAPTVTFGDEELTVNWNEPANDGSIITGYILTIGGSNDAPVELGAITTHTWRNLTNGTNYQFQVTAVNASGNSDTSPWSASEHPLREPDAPDAPIAGQGNRYLDIDWNQPNLNGDPVIEYQVQMESDQANPRSVTPTDYRWSDLSNGNFQRYRVRARNRDIDWSVWSAWSQPVRPCGAPLASTSVSAVFGDGLATLNWSQPDFQGCEITGYTIETAGAPAQSANGAALGHTFGGLTNGESYSFTVTATNEVGVGATSAASNTVVPAGPPLRANAPTVTPEATYGVVNCSAAAPANNGRPITSYRGSINDGAPFALNLTTAVGASTIGCRITDLAPTTDYRLKVQACNEIGCGSFSGNTSFRTFGYPSQPSNFTGSAGNGSVSASWSAATANGPGLYYYTILQTNTGIDNISRNTNSTSITYSANNGTAYGVWLQACNDIGCSSGQAIGDFTPRAPFNIQIVKSGFGPDPRPADCSTAACEYITTYAAGLNPGQTYSLQCQDASGRFGSIKNRTADGSGEIFYTQTCYYGLTGSGVSVFVGSPVNQSSNTIVW